MKEFRCESCQALWYSASQTDLPCQKCGGKLAETRPDKVAPCPWGQTAARVENAEDGGTR
jgi:hypothetical protein